MRILKTSISYVLKVLLQASFLGALTHADLIEVSNVWLQLKNHGSGSKTVCGYSITFILEKIKSMRPCFLLNKNINFNKNEWELKVENPTRSFAEMNLVLQLGWELGIKSKTVISWGSQNKKECIFCNVYVVRRKLF